MFEPVHYTFSPFHCWCLPRVKILENHAYIVTHRRWGHFSLDGGF